MNHLAHDLFDVAFVYCTVCVKRLAVVFVSVMYILIFLEPVFISTYYLIF